MGFRPCRDLIVTPLQVLWFLSQGNPRGQKTTRLHWPEGSVSHVKLTYGYWTEGEMYPACFWSVWVILFVLPYGTTPLCPYFKSFFFFRPRIVIKRRGEIIEFGGLIIIIRWGTKTSIPPFPYFITWTHLGSLFLLLNQIIAGEACTENTTSSRQEVCNLGTIPRCGDSNWQLNTCYDSV